MIPSNYTIRLNDIINNPEFEEVMGNYEIYDEDYRETLNQKIIDHYRYDEIGFETPKLFFHYLKCKLNEIMPKYNMLYRSEVLKIDPLANFSYKETFNKSDNSTGTSQGGSQGTANSTSSSTDNSTNTKTGSETENHVFQNTPQGDLVHETIDNFSYATTHNLDENNINESNTKQSTTNMQDSTTTNTSNNVTTSNNTTQNYIKNIIGNRNITTAKLFNEFVNNFVSIDKLIIDELYDLFMLVY